MAEVLEILGIANVSRPLRNPIPENFIPECNINKKVVSKPNRASWRDSSDAPLSDLVNGPPDSELWAWVRFDKCALL